MRSRNRMDESVHAKLACVSWGSERRGGKGLEEDLRGRSQNVYTQNRTLAGRGRFIKEKGMRRIGLSSVGVSKIYMDVRGPVVLGVHLDSPQVVLFPRMTTGNTALQVLLAGNDIALKDAVQRDGVTAQADDLIAHLQREPNSLSSQPPSHCSLSWLSITVPQVLGSGLPVWLLYILCVLHTLP